MFIVKPYLSEHIGLVFEFLYTLFYKHGVVFGQPHYVFFFSLKSCQWYAGRMEGMSLWDHCDFWEWRIFQILNFWNLKKEAQLRVKLCL